MDPGMILRSKIECKPVVSNDSNENCEKHKSLQIQQIWNGNIERRF